MPEAKWRSTMCCIWARLTTVRSLFRARNNDLTSTYFECDVPVDEADPRRFGYSRDKRGDCV